MESGRIYDAMPQAAERPLAPDFFGLQPAATGRASQ